MKLPTLQKIDRKQITLSGFSAGAFQASNLHVIHSNIFRGAALFGGGPFSYFKERAFKEAKDVTVANIIPHCFNAYVRG